MLIYFCHAYHSWEKGTNENTNGRLRRHIPKGKSIDALTDEDIANVEYALNHTPRKCLDYRTPDEVMTVALKIGRDATLRQLIEAIQLPSNGHVVNTQTTGCIN